MLTPDHIKPFLIHSDPDVRRLATEYFSGSWSEDPDLLPMVLDACERFGFDSDDNGFSLHYAKNFTVTEAALDRLLKMLEAEEAGETVERLNRILDHTPAEILKGRLEAVANHPNILPKTRLRIDRRLELLDWPGERLWTELQDFAHRSEDESNHEIDFDYADDLVEALSPHDVPDSATLCRLLKELEPELGWLEIFLVDLAGRRRLHEAVPVLVGKFHNDADYVLEQGSEALARIADPEAVRLVFQAYPDAPYYFRLFATGLLGRIKHPDSEAAILSMLELETDLDLRTWLCSALCDLLSDHALEVILKEIDSGNDTVKRELAGSAVAVATVLNVEMTPEIEALDQERRRQVAHMQQLRRQWAEEAQRPLSPIGSFDRPVRRQLPEPPVHPPIRNTGVRVGRNDPCTCGSGKKFKKCCGRPS